MGLQNQPHVIVFHEKNGRRHAHAVWCRIETDSMKAVHLPYYKNRMAELSKGLYLTHGWQLPKGHIEQAKRNPLNFSLYEWQQAKRLDVDPRVMKQALRQCWERSDNRTSFEHAIGEYGYVLAKGSRRGYVATDWRGEVISLSRWLGVKKRALNNRLGEEHDLPDIEQAKAAMDKKLIEQMQRFNTQIRQSHAPRMRALMAAKEKMIKRHQKRRAALVKKQRERERQAENIRQARHAQGLRGLWQRVTGQHQVIRDNNNLEAYTDYIRDQKERDALIFAHMNERRQLQNRINDSTHAMRQELFDTQQRVYSSLPIEKSDRVQRQLKRIEHVEQGYDFDM